MTVKNDYKVPPYTPDDVTKTQTKFSNFPPKQQTENKPTILTLELFLTLLFTSLSVDFRRGINYKSKHSVNAEQLYIITLKKIERLIEFYIKDWTFGLFHITCFISAFYKVQMKSAKVQKSNRTKKIWAVQMKI